MHGPPFNVSAGKRYVTHLPTSRKYAIKHTFEVILWVSNASTCTYTLLWGAYIPYPSECG